MTKTQFLLAPLLTLLTLGIPQEKIAEFERLRKIPDEVKRTQALNQLFSKEKKIEKNLQKAGLLPKLSKNTKNLDKANKLNKASKAEKLNKAGKNIKTATKPKTTKLIPNKNKQPKLKASAGSKTPGKWLNKVDDLSKIPSGCEKVADRAVKELGQGTQYLQITPNSGKFLGPVKGQSNIWGHHIAAIKNGKVYDQLTGPKGMSLDKYKQLFKYSDVLSFKQVSTRTLK